MLACAVLSGCGGGGSSVAVPASDPGRTPTQLSSGYPAGPASCDAPGQRAWLRDYLNDQYFWFDQQHTPDVAASTLPRYFASLLFTPLDRYSFAQNTTQFIQFFEQGQRTGYGYALAWSDAAQTVLKVRTVEPLSPIGLAGLRRGDTIVTIDGYTPEQIVSGLPARTESWGHTESLGQVFHYHILFCNQIMARPLRLEFARALNHVTYRGDRREDIYHYDAVCSNGGYDNERPDLNTVSLTILS